MKKLKNALVALVLVFCTFALVACGGKAQLDQEASVSKKGFVGSNKQEVTAVFEGDTKPEEFETTNFQATMTMKGTTTKGGISITMDILMNMYITCDEQGEPTGFAIKLKSGDDFVTNIYFQDKNAYFYCKSEKTELKCKMPLDPTSNEPVTSVASIVSMSSAIPTLAQLAFSNAFDVEIEGMKFEKAIKGDNARYHIAYTQPKSETEKEATYNLYIQLNKNTISAIEANVESNGINVKMAASQFNGEIKFPSFKGYKEASELEMTVLNTQIDAIIKSINGGIDL